MDNDVYRRAEQYLPWNLQEIIFNSTIFPYWSDEMLYYFQRSSNGIWLIGINTKTGKKEKIFDFQKLIDALSDHLKQEINLEELTQDKFSILNSPLQLCFVYQKKHWSFDLKTHICIKKEELGHEYLKSPDNNWAVQIKDYNIMLNNLVDGSKSQLTTDGEHYYDYASSPETNTRAVTQRLSGIESTPVAVWSPNSIKIVTHKLDQRNVKFLHLLQNSPNEGQRPELHSYRMSFSGDTDLPLAELVIIDVLDKTITPLKAGPLLSPYLTPIEFKWVWWSPDSQKVYFLRESRGSKDLMLCIADAATGKTEILITETAHTYIEPSALALWPHYIIVLEDRKEIIWLSERSGYSHIYLYNIGSSTPKKTITKGNWTVREIHFYDEQTNWLYLTVCGYDKNVDPYYKQLYRCRLDGSELQCLTKENANHTICISKYKDCFLDTYSTINTAPITLLKTMDGELLSVVETADISRLVELKWTPPKRLSFKARDQVTPIYGNVYFPSHLDPSKKYPIIDHIYPGPQIYRTSTHFSLYGALIRSPWIAQALAELGFIVIHVDGFGTPGRSKLFHDATYQNMSDCGIPDHVDAIKQLAEKFSFIDLDRVGITGFSGGAYAAVRAMLMYPDFFKVGVAAAGNHDIRCYPASYGEKYNGLDTFTYADQSNAVHAEKLQGKLLLVHGEMDDNVHPCASMQLIDSLIKHNKDFDMLIMPNQNHTSTFDHPYYMRRHWDYFVQNLLGESPPKNYKIKPMPENFPQIMDW